MYGTVVRISIDVRLISRPRWYGNFLMNLHIFIFFTIFYHIRYLLSKATDVRGMYLINFLI